MPSFLRFSMVALLSAAALSFTRADSVMTDPVGFITVKVAAGTAASPKLSLISPTLLNPVSWQGAVSAVTSTALTVSGSPWTANQFNGTNGLYFVEVVSGTKPGAWGNITATGTNSITVDVDLSSYASANSTVRIRPHVTISQFLGANNSAGLQGGPDAAHADQVSLYSGSVATNYFYYDGLQGGSAGWYDTLFNPAGSTPIYPSQGIVIKRQTASDVSFQFSNSVKTGATFIPVQPNLNVLGSVSGGDLMLANSGLYTGDPTTGVLAGPDSAHADQLTIYTATTQSVYWYYDGKQGGTAGWYDTSFNSAAAVVISPGSSFVIKRIPPGVAFNWIVPAPVFN